MIAAQTTSDAGRTYNYTPFTASAADESAGQLRARMDEEGYLFFPGLVPATEVLETRRVMLRFCQDAGWLDGNAELMDGVAAPGVGPFSEGMAEYMAVYRKVLKAPRFHDFPTHPNLMKIAAKLLNASDNGSDNGGDEESVEDVLVHPRRIGRITFPNFTIATTPPHQDHFYIRGAVDTYSCWIPLGACPMSLGGLSVWAGSHRQGFLEHSAHHPGAVGGRGVPVDEAQANWHCSDFGIGDTLFFHAFTIHKALSNLSENRLRLSTDNRYQRRQDDIDPGALLPHFQLD